MGWIHIIWGSRHCLFKKKYLGQIVLTTAELACSVNHFINLPHKITACSIWRKTYYIKPVIGNENMRLRVFRNMILLDANTFTVFVRTWVDKARSFYPHWNLFFCYLESHVMGVNCLSYKHSFIVPCVLILTCVWIVMKERFSQKGNNRKIIINISDHVVNE